MKLFGKRSLTAILSKILNIYFYIHLFIMVFLLLSALMFLSKSNLNDIVHKIPLVWTGNGIMIQYQGGTELLNAHYFWSFFYYIEGWVYLYMLLCLKRVFFNFGQGVIFSENQAKHIQQFGLLVVGLNIASTVCKYIFSHWVIDLVHISNTTITITTFFDIDLDSIFLGVFIIILSYVIKHGASPPG